MVPDTDPEKFTVVDAAPLQTDKPDGTVAVGVGLIEIVKFCVLPVQPFADGVTDTVPVVTAFELLMPVNEPILPEPEPPRPIVTLLLFHA